MYGAHGCQAKKRINVNTTKNNSESGKTLFVTIRVCCAGKWTSERVSEWMKVCVCVWVIGVSERAKECDAKKCALPSIHSYCCSFAEWFWILWDSNQSKAEKIVRIFRCSLFLISHTLPLFRSFSPYIYRHVIVCCVCVMHKDLSTFIAYLISHVAT